MSRGVPATIVRMIDANLNRAKEGLRVCEDVCRYAWDEKALTRDYKNARHALTQAVETLDHRQLLAARAINTDVGRSSTASEMTRPDMKALFWANNQRVKESLRVLEEASKIINPPVSAVIKKLRYTIYAIEKKALKRR